MLQVKTPLFRNHIYDSLAERFEFRFQIDVVSKQFLLIIPVSSALQDTLSTMIRITL